MVADFPKPSAQTIGFMPVSVQPDSYDSVVESIVYNQEYSSKYSDPSAVGKLLTYRGGPLPYLDSDNLEGRFASQIVGGIVVEGMEISANATPTKITIAAGSYYVGEFKQFATQQPTIVNPDNARILYVFIDAQGVITFEKEWKYGATICEIGQVRVNANTVVDVFNKVNKIMDLFAGFGDFITHSGVWWHGIGVGLNSAHSGFYSTDGFLFTSLGVSRQFIPGQDAISFNIVLPDGKVEAPKSVFTIAELKRYYANGAYTSINSSAQQTNWLVFIGAGGEFYLLTPGVVSVPTGTISKRVVEIQDYYQRTKFPEFLDTMATPIAVIMAKGTDNAMTELHVYSLQDNMSGGAYVDQNKGLPFPSPITGDISEPLGTTQLGVKDGRFAKVTKLAGVDTSVDGLVVMSNRGQSSIPISSNMGGNQPAPDGRKIVTMYTQNRFMTNGPDYFPVSSELPIQTLHDWGGEDVMFFAYAWSDRYWGNYGSWHIFFSHGQTIYNDRDAIGAALGELPENVCYLLNTMANNTYHYYLMADLEFREDIDNPMFSNRYKRIPELQQEAEELGNVSRGTWFSNLQYSAATNPSDSTLAGNVGCNYGFDAFLATPFEGALCYTLGNPYILAMSSGTAYIGDIYNIRLSDGSNIRNRNLKISELFKTYPDYPDSMRIIMVPNLLPTF